MREGRIMMVQYLTGIIAVFLVSIHLLYQGVIVPYSKALSFNQVLSLYRSIFYSSLLEILLIVILVHGFNGLRIILLEFRQTKDWEKAVDMFTISATIVTIAYGTRTIILSVFGGVS
jgi:succinate dehydrogenase / fumarate reductase membrane anchor subunit